VWAQADLKILGQYVMDPPAGIPVGEDVSIRLRAVIQNGGPFGAVDAWAETIATAPAGCHVTPQTHLERIVNLPVGLDITLNTPFTIRCDGLGQQTFSFDKLIELDVDMQHVRDPDDTNNTAHTELAVTSVAKADVKIVSASFVDPPTKLPQNQDVYVTLRKHIQNDGPWEPVDIAINATATAPTGCTVVPKSVPSSISAVPVGVDQVVDEVWTIKCTETGLKTFGFDNSIDVATLYVSDPNAGNNSSHKMLSVMVDLDSGVDSDGDGVLKA
jgi:hypothetical protein